MHTAMDVSRPVGVHIIAKQEPVIALSSRQDWTMSAIQVANNNHTRDVYFD